MAKVEDCPGFETFGADVKAARKARRLARKALAEMVGIEWRYLANIENKGTIPSLPVVIQLKFVMKLKSEFDTPGVGQITPEYRELHNEIKRLSHRLTKVTGEEREMVLAEYKSKRQKLMTIPCTAQTDKKLKYVRYADDFLIAVKGNREDCQWIKSKLAEFIGDTLKMELSEDKTLITHSSKCARFLG